MNRLGKELKSKTISENKKSIITRQRPPPISLNWKEDSMDLSPVENTLDRKSDDKLEQKGTEALMSGRCRKHPITRKDDSFMVNWSVKESDLIINDRNTAHSKLVITKLPG
jgi:hypothetical protein